MFKGQVETQEIYLDWPYYAYSGVYNSFWGSTDTNPLRQVLKSANT